MNKSSSRNLQVKLSIAKSCGSKIYCMLVIELPYTFYKDSLFVYWRHERTETQVNKLFSLLGVSLFVILLTVYWQFDHPKVQESITFFPIDPNVQFKSAETSIKQLTNHTLLWRIQSTLDRKAYLRQDAGFLYENGKLIAELHEWKQNTSQLSQEKQISIKRNALYEAISLHHAELHEKGGQIFSSQAMSEDQLYVVKTVVNGPVSYRLPQTREQEEWKRELDSQTVSMLQSSWNKGIRWFSISLNNYQAYPLNEFNIQAKKSLPGFTKNETDRIAGNLWEGLYKNYLLGIKKADGTIMSPIGSTIPLILIAKDKTHLLVLSESANGNPILLRQMIGDID